MEKEKVVVAMSNDPGSSSVCKNLGAEISIGRIPFEKQTELKQAVFNDKVIEMFDLIMKDNFQVLLNSVDDEKLNKAGLRSKMPEGWKFGDDPFARYIKGGIDLNSLKKV